MDENTLAHDQLMRFGAGGESALHLPAIVILAVTIVLILFLPRKYLFAPFTVASLVIPLGPQLVLGGLHFTAFRILIAFGWLRLLIGFISHRNSRPSIQGLDKVVVAWAIANAIAFCILWGQWGAVVERLGFLYNALGLYFFYRVLIRDDVDIDRITRVLVWCSVLIAACMMYEQHTARNLFALIGGVPEFDGIREGRIRAQGPFAHPILAGVFGGILIPLFYRLRWRKSDKYSFSAWLGIVAASVVVFASASSTPLMAFAGGLLALCFWPLRRHMRVFRWGVLITLVGLHLVMKAPVWALISRVNVVGGSSGYHRFLLVDQLIRRFGEWWLVGAQNPSSWAYEAGDTSNQFMDVAVTGGILSLVLFITILVKGFQRVGIARSVWEDDQRMRGTAWSLGAALFANFMAFWGTAYFDQVIILWYALLAMIASLPVVREAESSVSAGSGHETQFVGRRRKVETLQSMPTAKLGCCSIAMNGRKLRILYEK